MISSKSCKSRPGRLRCFDRFVLMASVGIAFWVCAGNAGAQLRGPKVAHESQRTATLKRPGAIYVSDFAINLADFESSGPAERLNDSGLRARIKSLRGEDPSPEGKAQAVVDQMGDGIVQELQKKGLKAARVRANSVPGMGWLVRGRFYTIDSGSRALKASVGFGAGSTDVNVDVTLDEVIRGKAKPILLFDTTNSNGKGPGGLAIAAATKNPYAMAVKFVRSGRDLQKNISKTAKLIAEQIATKASA